MSDETLQTAVRMLARREHSCFELQQKLKQKGFAVANIAEVLEKLTAKNLINDKRFAESYFRSRSNKGYGPIRISAELKEKGISKELVSKLVKNEDVSAPNIEQIRAKKFGAELPTNEKDRAKQIRYLQYKGFGWEEIKKIKFTQ